MAFLPRVTIRHDRTGQLPGAVQRAVVRALNRAIATVRTDTTRRLAQEMGITRGTVRERLRITKATGQRLEAILTVTGKRIPILDFAARQTREGVTYRKGGASRGLIPSGFIATMKSGHRGVFKRRSRSRLPIVERFGASLPYVAIRQKILQASRDVGDAAFKKNLAHELVRELEKA